MRIDELDKNFKIETKIKLKKPKAYDPRKAPFKIYGVTYEEGMYRRMPKSVADSTNAGVSGLHEHTAGGRIRFKTNSKYVAIKTRSQYLDMHHMALVGSSGFDLYVGHEEEYARSFIPTEERVDDGYESVAHFPTRKMRELTLNMPLYSRVYELYIILEEGATVESADDYDYEKPIVYYGSSITQGGCASRPGNCYQGHISRALNTNYINLGFSGSARGEDTMAEYIAGLNMSAFVYDYDHNAPTVEHLRATHERMFKLIRAKHPTLPILILSRPSTKLDKSERERLNIIKQTYINAIEAGDKNVCFIPGNRLMKIAGDDGLVDGCHPTDLGFYSMAMVMLPTVRKMLNI